ncbi:hypothetical protein ABZ777_32505 [Micromonospora parva]|uniref:hypothetical protein n=1 Tax=Micromonospora parva TaxID=1464048 RepID=UPI003409A7E2
MTAAPGAHIYRNASVLIDEEEYTNQLTTARLVPDQPVQTMRTLDPTGTQQDVDTPVWTFEISGLQINIPSGLAAVLRAANGEPVEIVLQPKVGTGLPTATFTAIALMPPFGGEQGNWLTQELSLPVVGQPVFGVSA